MEKQTMIPPRQELVLNLRYGLNDRIERSLEEVGMILKISRERVRQIESAALKSLRKTKEFEQLIDDY